MIGAVQGGAAVNQNVLTSLKTYCEHNNAQLIMLQLPGKNIHDNKLSRKLYNENIITGDYKLNNSIYVRDFGIRPTQIKPLTGIDRFIKRDGSAIIGATKQHLRVAPNSNQTLPKLLMTTGALTHPNYNQNNRIGRIAKNDHEYGAILVEIINKKFYHTRMLSANRNGKIYDIDTLYDGKKVIGDQRPEALVLGDYHLGLTNDAVRSDAFDMIEKYQPKVLVLHDFFNGHSISHHDKNKIISQNYNFKKCQLSLEEELQNCAAELDKLKSVMPSDGKIVLVKSNHDETLYRYLDEGRFIKEPQNAELASYLLHTTLKGEDPIKTGIELYTENDMLTFLKREDDYKIRGYDLGNHGDKGPNGARGSKFGRQRNYGRNIGGHDHTGSKYGDSYNVGTSTNLIVNYNRGGTSSWDNTHCLLHANSKGQLIRSISGHHRGDRV